MNLFAVSWPSRFQRGFSGRGKFDNQAAGIFRAAILAYQLGVSQTIDTAGEGATGKHNFDIEIPKPQTPIWCIAEGKQNVIGVERNELLPFQFPFDGADDTRVTDQQLLPSGELLFAERMPHVRRIRKRCCKSNKM